MGEQQQAWWRGWLRPRFFSPRGFQALAAAFTVVFLACHVLGLRAYTCVLCGQAPTGDAAARWAFGLGCLYILFYYAFVLGAPTLLLASLLLGALERLARRRGGGAAS